MMSNFQNQNMDSWKSGSRLQAMSEAEFPSLSEASTEKSSGKKKFIKLVVPLKTYGDELREKYRESRPFLENLKTRICNSLDKNEVCPHGDGCRFAHSLEDLVIRDCYFKDNCRFVKIKSGKLVNDGDKICRNKHSQESKDDFIKRTGLSHYKTTAPKHEEINVDDVNVHEEPTVKQEQSFACDKQTNYNCAAANKSFLTQGSASVKFVCPVPFTAPQPVHEPLPPTFKFGAQPSLEKEIVLRVPKVLAIQALELAMNSGNRCIRLEVTE